jgi:hypothetical protein
MAGGPIIGLMKLMGEFTNIKLLFIKKFLLIPKIAPPHTKCGKYVDESEKKAPTAIWNIRRSVSIVPPRVPL